MIKIENVQIAGWEPALRGMRNPMNSWDKSDSYACHSRSCVVCRYYLGEGRCEKDDGVECDFSIGENDLKLANSLSKAGPVHAKYRRMIVVYLDITAPLYWWKEFDTYAVGTVKNSCSTMHKIHERALTIDDFSHEHLTNIRPSYHENALRALITLINCSRESFLETENKDDWWQMIQLLPSSYNQRRTVMLNYEVLDNIRHHRSNHKLDEWREFCAWTDTLPYIDDICPKEE